MQLNDLVREWVQKGRQDIDSAVFLSRMKPLPKEIIGFHCQQAVEKCLKAILVLHDSEPPRSHDLLFLRSMGQSFDTLPEIDASILSRLNPYAVDHRYPVESTVTESDVLKDLGETEAIVKELVRCIEIRMIN